MQAIQWIVRVAITDNLINSRLPKGIVRRCSQRFSILAPLRIRASYSKHMEMISCSLFKASTPKQSATASIATVIMSVIILHLQ